MRIEAPGPIDSCFRGRALEPTAALIEETLTRTYPVNAHTHYIQIPGALSYPFDAQDGRT